MWRIENNTAFGERVALKAMPRVKYIQVELDNKESECTALIITSFRSKCKNKNKTSDLIVEALDLDVEDHKQSKSKNKQQKQEESPAPFIRSPLGASVPGY